MTIAKTEQDAANDIEYPIGPRLHIGEVGVCRDAANVVALAHLGNELAVCAVGVGDEPLVHLADAQNLIHNHLRITLLKLGLFGKEVGTAYFYGVGCWHIKNGLVTAKVIKPLYAIKDGLFVHIF